MVVADGFLTNTLIHRNLAREGNPLLTGIAGTSGFPVIKFVGVILAVVIMWDVHRRYPRLAFWASALFLLIYTAIVAWNLRILLTGMNP
jgi:hypothetical protein